MCFSKREILALTLLSMLAKVWYLSHTKLVVVIHFGINQHMKKILLFFKECTAC